MMYLAIKTIHVISSAILFGTGIGTAFFMWMANRSRNRQAMTIVTGHVMKADLYFTTPSIIIQPLSGFALVRIAHFRVDFSSPNWLVVSFGLYLLAGACWLPVLWLQAQMHEIVSAVSPDLPIPAKYWVYEKIWKGLGVPAFLSLVVIFWMMIAKPF
jgi:uncharacterized membrane protein